jgi:putative ABC transport system substrate-binding protein
MKKKITVLILSALLLALSYSASAQQPTKVPRIGYLSPTGDSHTSGPDVEAFRQGLRDLGYIEGKNILVEYRFIEGKTDRTSNLVGELVKLNVDVLVVLSSPSIRAAKQATKTIPVVMITTQDPVARGFIDSLARPGANITGVSTLQRELSGKRLELLKEGVPGISRAAALVGSLQTTTDFELYKAPARALKIQLQLLEVVSKNPDIDALFRAAVKEARTRSSRSGAARSTAIQSGSQTLLSRTDCHQCTRE